VGDRAGDEGFELLDRFVGDPAGADAQRFADAFAEDMPTPASVSVIRLAQAPRS
jgi:hypothetical protein